MSYNDETVVICVTSADALIDEDRNSFNAAELSEGYLHDFMIPMASSPCGPSQVIQFDVEIAYNSLTNNLPSGCAFFNTFANVLLNPGSGGGCCTVAGTAFGNGNCFNFGVTSFPGTTYNEDLNACQFLNPGDVVGIDIIPAVNFAGSCSVNGMAISAGAISVDYEICVTITVRNPEPPIVNAGDDVTIGCNETITIGADPVATDFESTWTYSWDNGVNGTFDPDNGQIMVSPTMTTIYTVEVTGEGGCTATDEIEVTYMCCPDPGGCDDGDCTNGVETWDDTICDCVPNAPTEVLGCTDPAFCEYDPLATCDDGTCLTPNTDPGTCDDGDCTNGLETWDATSCSCMPNPPSGILGCTDPAFCEYDPLATCDDGTCFTPNTDPGTCDDGDCTNGLETWDAASCSCMPNPPTGTFGCTDPAFCEYDPLATCDDGTCFTPNTDPGTCDDGDCTNGLETWDTASCSCMPNPPSGILGCTDPAFCEYDPLATCDDGTCFTPNTDPGTCDDGDCTNGLETWDTASCSCMPNPPSGILGCTDPAFCEYDPLATCDDGTCFTLNIDPGCDDGDCTNGIETWDTNTCSCMDNPPVEVLGCTDPSSCNYNPLATCDDGSCTGNGDPGTCNTDCNSGDIEIWSPFDCMCVVDIPTVLGCTDPLATNFNPLANCEDFSCDFGCPDPGCNQDCTLGDIEVWNDIICDCVVDIPTISGCTDINSCNYNPLANCDDGSCIPNDDPGTCNTDCLAGDIEVWNPATCNCEISIVSVLGCTNNTANNFDPSATCDDGSCDFSCPDPGTCNQDCTQGNLEVWDGINCECIVDVITIEGCTNPNSCNFNPMANCDDGNCIPNDDPGTCNTDCLLGDVEMWDAASCNCVLVQASVIGCTDPTATNYNPSATCDDGSCDFSCPDPGTCNQDCTQGDLEVWDAVNCECIVDVITVQGCTDPNSCNFNPLANCDDGSCVPNTDPGTCNTDCLLGNVEMWDVVSCTCIEIETSILGCTNATATNFDPNATCDDGSCDFSCPDPGICNQDCLQGDLEVWDGVNCECTVDVPSILGCSDPGADNYNPLANCDDGSCTFSCPDPGTCNQDCTLGDLEIWDDVNCECMVDEVIILGCTDPNSCNYNPLANCDDGNCIPNDDPGTCNTDCLQGDVESWDVISCTCVIIEASILGCTNPTANNYNPTATCDDGSCDFACPDPGTCNQDCSQGDIEVWDGVNCECIIQTTTILGCTDPNSCNFNPMANCDDGSCISNADPGTCNTDCTLGDVEIWDVNSCSCVIATQTILGCTDPAATNYNPLANCDDGSCDTSCPDPGTCNIDCTLGDLEIWDNVNCECIIDVPTVLGCTDPNSCNYNPLANCDDGSCIPNDDPGTCNTDCALGDIEEWNTLTCMCDVTVVSILGCTNPTANNYDPTATCDDGTCDFDCPDPGTCNLDCTIGDIEVWDGINCECVVDIATVLGCTDPSSLNFNPMANCDDGSCQVPCDKVIGLFTIDPDCEFTDAGEINITVNDPVISGVVNAPFVIQNLTDPDAVIIESNVSDISGLTAGEYLIIIEFEDGCTQDTIITLNEPEGINVNVVPQTVSGFLNDIVSIEIETDSPESVVSISYSPALEVSCDDCLEPEFMLSTNATYELSVVDTEGCISTSTFETVILQEPDTSDIFIPNIFDPRSEFGNDNFVIFSTNPDLVIQSMEIFDRWGNVVFEQADFPANDPSYGWNGLAAGSQQVPGVYVVKIEYTNSEGIPVLIVDDLTIIQ